MDQFKDLVADDMPQTGERLGYSAVSRMAAPVPPAPPVISPPPRENRFRQGNRN